MKSCFSCDLVKTGTSLIIDGKDINCKWTQMRKEVFVAHLELFSLRFPEDATERHPKTCHVKILHGFLPASQNDIDDYSDKRKCFEAFAAVSVLIVIWWIAGGY
jgi:hypothetical protein